MTAALRRARLVAMPDRSASDIYNEVARLRAAIERVGDVLSAEGCGCECEHHWEEHADDCERCLGCRVEMALDGAAGVE